MAAQDTIVILNGLQFEQTAAASIAYTFDGAGLECVKTYSVTLPDTASSARVIFNGNYDPGGANHCVRVKVTKVTSMASGVPTKTENTQAMEWTVVNPDSATPADRMMETGEIDISAAIIATLHIDVAVCEAEATTGLEVIVQVRSEASKEEWTDVTRFIGPTGTGLSTALAATEPVGETVLLVTDPTTKKFNSIGKFIFILNTTPASSEICWLMDCGAD
mgnify:CR=1 FL=1